MRTKFHLHAQYRYKFEEWRSKFLMLFVAVVVMETMYYACAPSFTSMRAIVSKFEESISSFK